MDTLTFGSPIVLRHLTFSEARKMPIEVINLQDVLKGLNLDMDKVGHRTLGMVSRRTNAALSTVHRDVHAVRL